VKDIVPGTPPLLDVRGLSHGRHFAGVSFTAPPGTIVGIAGVQGSGHGELLRAIGGVAPVDSGEVRVDGRIVRPNDPVASVDAGVLTVPADRRGAAIVAEQSVRANIALTRRLRAEAHRWGFRNHAVERQIAKDYIDKLGIRPPLTEMKIGQLSGGNQQKVAIARILEGAPRVLAVEEPTQGIDVRAKAEIHALLHRVARQSGAVVVIATSEFEELLGLADDIHVMRSGRLGHHIPGSRATYHEILENALP
jgi:ABC-type sugar transport system ATPase subunit